MVRNAGVELYSTIGFTVLSNLEERTKGADRRPGIVNPWALEISLGSAWGQPHISHSAHALPSPTQSCSAYSAPDWSQFLSPHSIAVSIWVHSEQARNNGESADGQQRARYLELSGSSAARSSGPSWTLLGRVNLADQVRKGSQGASLHLLAWAIESRGRSGIPGDGPCASQMHLCHLLASGSHCTARTRRWLLPPASSVPSWVHLLWGLSLT